MSLTWSSPTSPGGRTYLRTVSAGLVTEGDAQHFNHVIGKGQLHRGRSILAIVEAGAEFTPEARTAFMGMGSVESTGVIHLAIVVSSAPLRVLLSFVIRMSGGVSNTRFFENEAAATRWLHQSLDS